METLWFVLVGVLLILFVMLDGFDFGAGIIYRYVARTNEERRIVLNALGPVWDGNEVWLIIAGGTLFFAFPDAYASSFSGYYLALIPLLWLLMFRGLSMELRSQINNPLWHSFWDTMLTIGSLLISLMLGAAMGNLMRGVPLQADGYFFLPLWTNFMTGTQPGLLDWYTLLTAVFAIIIFGVHGANFIALKTQGMLQQRARDVSQKGNWAVGLFSLTLPFATYVARPEMIYNYSVYPVGAVLPVLAIATLAAMFYFRFKQEDLSAFMASAATIVFLMLSATFTIYPNILIATTDPANSLTIYNTATSDYALQTGLIWFTAGAVAAAAYTVYMYRSFRGKVVLPDEGEGY